MMDANDLPDEMAMAGNGTIATRTNVVIATAIHAMHDQNVRLINRPNLSTLITKRLDAVGTEDTAAKYVKRVVRHGPFEPDGIGTWRLTDDGWAVAAEHATDDDDGQVENHAR